jgi:cytochrome c oxidase subunit 2
MKSQAWSAGRIRGAGRVATVIALMAACKAAPSSPRPAATTAAAPVARATAPVATPAAPVAQATALPMKGVVFLDTAPADALTLEVRVTRWSCDLTDPDGVPDQELHVPLGRAIHLSLHDDDRDHDVDVQIEHKIVHVARGGTAQLVFRADQQENYAWQCPVRTDFTPPPDFAMHLFTHSPGDYVAYQRAQDERMRPTTREGRIRLGKQVYEKTGCNACHSDDGSPRVGVSFAGLWGQRVTLVDGSTHTVDEQFIKESLENPSATRQPGYRPVMPSFKGYLRPEEMSAVAAYIESLGHD